MSEVLEKKNQKSSLIKGILIIILLVLQIVELIFSISQTVAKDLGLPYSQAIFYLIIILSGLIIYFLFSDKRRCILRIYILLIIILTIIINPIKNRVEGIKEIRREKSEDYANRFEISKQIMGVIIPDFESPNGKEGDIFAESLYIQLRSKTSEPLKIVLRDTTFSLKIQVQKVEGIWDTSKMKIRGSRRNADLGIIGNYRRYLEKGKLKEAVSDFKVVILDTQIAPIFIEKKPYDDIYEFIIPIEDIEVTQRDSLPLKEKASYPIEYIINVAGNTKLLQRATQVNKLNRDQTLSTLHQRLASLGNLIENHSLACFHHGNSLVRTAMNPQLSLDDQRELIKEASRAYWTSIRRISMSELSTLKIYYPERIYFNLAWSYIRLNRLTGNSAFKDSAEAVYDSVVTLYPNRETFE